MGARMTLDDQIRCAGRELGLRRNVYPKFIKSGRMTQAEADHEIAAMAEVYATLKQLKADQGAKVEK